MHKKNELKKQTLKALIDYSVQHFANQPAISFVDGNTLTYAELGKKIVEIRFLLNNFGLQKGDKVAIYSNNMPNWVIAYFAIISEGMIVLPILPDFNRDEVMNVLEHAEARMIFVSEKLNTKINDLVLPELKTKIILEDFSVLQGDKSKENTFSEFTDVVKENDIAAIIYTSGTTGRSKGVVLTHKNIMHIVNASYDLCAINQHDVFLSFLPLSHTYENSLGMLYPMKHGASVYYLEKPPTAALLLPALKKIKPTVMLSVPLIMEKIYKAQVQAKFASNEFANMIYKTPVFRKIIHGIAGKKLKETFGGRLKFFGIGGAKLDPTVERFLHEAKFPYAIGYGLTETAPLLAGASPSQTKLESTGFAITGVKLKIHEPNEHGIGEIWAKGPNIMQGYYKNPEATADVLVDGWFRTGDYGELDKHNRLFIKGRMKNMIVGSSGENIYPEDIESVINNNQYVLESLVVEEDGYLVAKILLDIEKVEKSIEHYHQWVKHLHHEINSKLNRISQIKRIDIMEEPFEKTASQKIKRFMYNNKHINKHNDKAV